MMVNESLKEDLSAEIEDARECYENPPPNEASTCDWVILPILHAAGYSKKDIISQAGNAGNAFPDYTVLPNTPDTWYLEAKDWKKNLENGPEAIQALNYANAHGQRWVVLSNGKEWLLFDNHIQGVQADKRIVARAEVTDPGFMDFMLALSKPSVQSGGLATYAATWRLREVLRQQLLTKDSQVVKAILKAVKAEAGLAGIHASDVVQYFGEILGNQSVVVDAASQPDSPNELAEPIASGKSLAELLGLGHGLAHSKPTELMSPDGVRTSVHNWSELACKVVERIAQSPGLPVMPFRGLPGGKRWFLSSSPVHEDGSQMTARLLHCGGQEVYVDVNRSCPNFVKCLCNLCDACGVPTTSYSVQLVQHGNAVV